MKAPIRIVAAAPEHDTIDVLRRLLREAETGELIGVAFTALYAGRQWVSGTTGEAERDLARAAGLVHAHSAALAHRLAYEHE